MSSLFNRWDEDGDGLVNRAEFLKAMRNLGLRLSDEEVCALFTRCDPDGSGTVDLREFSKLLRESRGLV